jgi:hypothetical protein
MPSSRSITKKWKFQMEIDLCMAGTLTWTEDFATEMGMNNSEFQT